MRYLLAATAGLVACGTAAQAQDVTFKPIADARLRYELADQDGLTKRAGAVTLRLRPGVVASIGEWSALVEGETNIVLVDQYNDGTNGKIAYPLVVDPPNAELNRAQIRYAGANGFTVTAGGCALAARAPPAGRARRTAAPRPPARRARRLARRRSETI